MAKELIIIAGPNGAGKTTFVNKNFPDDIKDGSFLNADVYASEVSPNDVGGSGVTGARKLLNNFDSFLNTKDKFVIETTLSGQTLKKRVQKAKSRKFNIQFVFLWITDIEMCDFRVKERVTLGGHHVPYPDIQRRFIRGLANVPPYLDSSDEVQVYFANANPRLIFSKDLKSGEKIWEPDLYGLLKQQITDLKTAPLLP